MMMISAVVPNPGALVEICDFPFSSKLDVNDDVRDTARESLDYRKSFATSRMIAMRYARRELRRSRTPTFARIVENSRMSYAPVMSHESSPTIKMEANSTKRVRIATLYRQLHAQWRRETTRELNSRAGTSLGAIINVASVSASAEQDRRSICHYMP